MTDFRQLRVIIERRQPEYKSLVHDHCQAQPGRGR